MEKAMDKISQALKGKTASNTGSNPGDLPADAAPGTDEEFGAARQTAVPGKSTIGPRPGDLPLDASPGTDEEFGAQAAMRNRSAPAQKVAGPGPTDSNDDRVEGVLLSG